MIHSAHNWQGWTPHPDSLFTEDEWQVHHDAAGFYLVGPDELRDEGGFGPDGVSLGWDGRPHFSTRFGAWRHHVECGGGRRIAPLQ